MKGFDLGDGQPALLDLRFADDILLFAKSYSETVSLLHDLVTALSQVGLILNANKTVVLTNEAQPPQHLQLPFGERVPILEHNSGQKWLGCILTARGSKLHHVDVKHHLQQASKAFFGNRWILTDHQVSIATRLRYFDKVVPTVACFAAGHRALYKNDLLNMDVSYRKLCRQIVGPPPGPNWSLDWHEILHFWNERVKHFAALAGVKLIIGSSQGMWRASLHTNGLNVCWLGLVLGLAMPDVLQTVGIKNWLLIVDTKILDIGWMLLKTSTGGNLIWTT